jgi:hypothetical protein
MNEEREYTLETEDGRFLLRTTSFKAEKGSVLHSGIFSRELSSSFVAFVIAVAVLFLMGANYGLSLAHYILASVVFVILFPVLRIYVFRRPLLETLYDGDSGILTITLITPFRRKTVRRPAAKLRDVRLGHTRIEPENPDGIAVVEKVALQHGTVIPGFGKAEDFFNIELVFDDESYIILTTGEKTKAEEVLNKLKGILSDASYKD